MLEIDRLIRFEGVSGLSCKMTDKENFPPNIEHRFAVPITITPDNLHGVIQGIKKLENKQPGGYALLEIESKGGDVKAAFDLASVMRNSSLRIATLSRESHSMAVLLTATGEKGLRYAHVDTSFILHQINATLSGSYSLVDLGSEREQLREKQKLYTRLLANATGQSVKALERLLKTGDHYLSADMAKELGVIDHIIPDLKP